MRTIRLCVFLLLTIVIGSTQATGACMGWHVVNSVQDSYGRSCRFNLNLSQSQCQAGTMYPTAASSYFEVLRWEPAAISC